MNTLDYHKLGKSSVPISSPGEDAFAPSATPNWAQSEQVKIFQQMLNNDSDSGSLLKKTSPPAGILSSLSDHFKAQGEQVARMVGASVDSRDPVAMHRVSVVMQDNSIESDLVAKVIGKTVSAVDQLTKLN